VGIFTATKILKFFVYLATSFCLLKANVAGARTLNFYIKSKFFENSTPIILSTDSGKVLDDRVILYNLSTSNGTVEYYLEKEKRWIFPAIDEVKLNEKGEIKLRLNVGNSFSTIVTITVVDKRTGANLGTTQFKIYNKKYAMYYIQRLSSYLEKQKETIKNN